MQHWHSSLGSEAAIEPCTATVLIDDLRVGTAPAEPPLLTLVRAANGLEAKMSGLTPGKTYKLRASPDLTHWTPVTETTATATTASWAVPQPAGRSFYVSSEKQDPALGLNR